jgi:hypothetical protein
LKTTITKKAINNGRILISSEHARFLFHDIDAERISFNDNKSISAATPRIPTCGAPVDAAEIIPEELLMIVLANITT